MQNFIYLDNAATTFPKPQGVYNEVRRCMEEYCGNPGRSGHALSLESARAVYKCREKLAEFFALPAPENTVFTLNTTYALNIAIKAYLKKDDHVIISNIEHNSVYRPIAQSGCRFDIFNSFASREAVLRQISAMINPKTKMIICSHHSNISPLRNPIEEIGRLAKRRGLLFIVDAAQSAGIYELDMESCNIDILCIPSHKGLYGIQGCGAALFSSRISREDIAQIKPLAEGGNGVNSLESFMPDFLPERLEAGTLPTPAIAGLCAGVEAISEIGKEHIREHLDSLYRRAREQLGNNKAIILYCREFAHGHTLLFNVKGHSSIEITDRLNDEGICVRGGFHCSPLAHNLLKTGENGAVRVSFGAFNTLEETDIFCNILNEIIKEG